RHTGDREEWRMPRSSSLILPLAEHPFAPPPLGLLGLVAAPIQRPDELRERLSRLPEREVAPLLQRFAAHRLDGLAHLALSRLPRDGSSPWLRAALQRRHQ